MSKKTVFVGAGVALVTPMQPDGTPDLARYRELVEWQIQNGTDAIITCGTTGESSTLDHEEHVAVMRAAVEQTAGRVPVIAGTGSNDTAYGIRLSLEAREAGVDALLLVTPYYNKASQKGLIAHFNAIADAAQIPCILYNVPSRTGVNIKPETVAELYKNPYIVGIKEASGSLSAVAQIAALCDIDIYSGNDDQTVPMLALGAKGVISVLSNVLPRETHDIVNNWMQGDVAGSRALQLKYLKLANALFCDVNPIPVKYAMNRMGMQVGPCRLPLCEPEAKAAAYIDEVLAEYGLVKG